MNHPNREELTGFLYEELGPAERQAVAAHLEGCAECQAQLETWQAVRRDLTLWQLPKPHRAARRWVAPHWLQRAAAAVLLLGMGFALARWTAPASPTDPAAIRAAVARDLREELRAELADFSAEQTSRQEEYHAALIKALARLEAQRQAEYALLRKDVETVAVRAEDELQNARENLVRLASFEK